MHLEKGSSYAETGQLIPPFDSEATLNKLIYSMKINKINKIILLGDTFHDEGALERMDLKSQGLLRYILDNYNVIFILGNHENKMKLEKITFYHDYVIDNNDLLSFTFFVMFLWFFNIFYYISRKKLKISV